MLESDQPRRLMRALTNHWSNGEFCERPYLLSRGCVRGVGLPGHGVFVPCSAAVMRILATVNLWWSICRLRIGASFW